MYDNNIACEPQKEAALEQIITDGHDAIYDIEAAVNMIGFALFGIDPNEPKRDDSKSIYAVLMDDVNAEKRIVQKLNHIIGRLR